jgi:hypothetical protein
VRMLQLHWLRWRLLLLRRSLTPAPLAQWRQRVPQRKLLLEQGRCSLSSAERDAGVTWVGLLLRPRSGGDSSGPWVIG